MMYTQFIAATTASTFSKAHDCQPGSQRNPKSRCRETTFSPLTKPTDRVSEWTKPLVTR